MARTESAFSFGNISLSIPVVMAIRKYSSCLESSRLQESQHGTVTRSLGLGLLNKQRGGTWSRVSSRNSPQYAHIPCFILMGLLLPIRLCQRVERHWWIEHKLPAVQGVGTGVLKSLAVLIAAHLLRIIGHSYAVALEVYR